MNIKPDCLVCIYNQALKTTKLLELDDKKAGEIMFKVAEALPSFSMQNTPPQIAKETYALIEKETKLKDPLKKIKKEAIKEAKSFVPFLEKKIKNSKNGLYTAIKIAVAGNVIDFGAKEQFELKDTINSIFHKKFAINEFKDLEKKLKKSKSLVILADNAGENIFDVLLAKTIKKLYPKIEIHYFVRGKPIINDVTKNDVKNSNIKKYAKVIDTKVPTPGFDLQYASKKSLKIYHKADIVISKGMGNYESLYKITKREVFYLFKVKCNVVADSINKNIGSIILMKDEI